MTLITKPAPPASVLGDWLDAPAFHPMQRAIVRAALNDSNKHESPLGSNRSPYIDALCTWAGSPLGSYWCAIAAGAWLAKAGCRLPYLFPACDYWLPYMVETKTLPADERVACALLYGKRGTIPITAEHRRRADVNHAGADKVVAELKGGGWDAQHIAIVSHWIRDPYDLVLTTEGNRGYAGLAIGTPNNGIAVDTAPLTRKDVLGVVPWRVLMP
jgi:hypothetical protein